MNITDTQHVLARVRGYQPGTRDDNATVGAWHTVLGNYARPDVEKAVDQLFAQNVDRAGYGARWVTPADVAAQVRRNHEQLTLTPGWREVVCEVCRRPRFEHDECEAKVKPEHRHEFRTFTELQRQLVADRELDVPRVRRVA